MKCILTVSILNVCVCLCVCYYVIVSVHVNTLQIYTYLPYVMYSINVVSVARQKQHDSCFLVKAIKHSHSHSLRVNWAWVTAQHVDIKRFKLAIDFSY